MGSPEQRRVPSASTSHFNAFPPPPLPSSPPRPVSAPVAFNAQPAEMVFTLNDWQPVATSSTRGRGQRHGAHPLPHPHPHPLASGSGSVSLGSALGSFSESMRLSALPAPAASSSSFSTFRAFYPADSAAPAPMLAPPFVLAPVPSAPIQVPPPPHIPTPVSQPPLYDHVLDLGQPLQPQRP